MFAKVITKPPPTLHAQDSLPPSRGQGGLAAKRSEEVISSLEGGGRSCLIVEGRGYWTIEGGGRLRKRERAEYIRVWWECSPSSGLRPCSTELEAPDGPALSPLPGHLYWLHGTS